MLEMIFPAAMLAAGVAIFFILAGRLLFWQLAGYDIAQKIAQYKAKIEKERIENAIR